MPEAPKQAVLVPSKDPKEKEKKDKEPSKHNGDDQKESEELVRHSPLKVTVLKT